MTGWPRLRVGSMCTGYGGLDLAVLSVYDAELAWCTDNDAHVQRILHARFPGVPNLGDLLTVAWRQAPPVDVVTAGFPCQDISYAGQAAGIKEGTRSGLWITIVDALRLLRPRLLVVENVAALRSRGLGKVLGDLAALGYDARWLCLRACDIGAPHRRERVFLAAHPAGTRLPWSRRPAAAQGGRSPAQRRRLRLPVPGCGSPPTLSTGSSAGGGDWGPYRSAIGRWEAITGRTAPEATELGRSGQLRLSARFVEWLMGLPDGWVTATGIPYTAQIRALGNGVVPHQAAQALRDLATLDAAQKQGRAT